MKNYNKVKRLESTVKALIPLKGVLKRVPKTLMSFEVFAYLQFIWVGRKLAQFIITDAILLNLVKKGRKAYFQE